MLVLVSRAWVVLFVSGQRAQKQIDAVVFVDEFFLSCWTILEDDGEMLACKLLVCVECALLGRTHKQPAKETFCDGDFRGFWPKLKKLKFGMQSQC